MDANDMLARLKSLTPYRWFSNAAPVRDAVFGGIADSLAWCYDFIQYAARQTRLATMSDQYLDMMALDFFGLRIIRRASQSDDSFRSTILKEIFRERGTRKALIDALKDLTSHAPKIFEPTNPQDSGGWGVLFAFNAAGRWGAAMPRTVFIDAYEPPGSGIPNLAGLNSPQAGWGAGSFAFAELIMVTGPVTNQDIYDTVEATRAAGVTAWVSISSPTQ